ALFYNVPYTESLFLLASVGAAYHFLRAEWIASSCFGLLVGLTRPNGCFVSILLGILALQQSLRSGRGLKTAPYITAAMPGIGMLIFTLFLYRLTGVWFAWARSHEAWGRTYQGFGPFMTAFGWL